MPFDQLDPYKRSNIPRGYHQKLPAFRSSVQNPENDPAWVPTTAYVLVGPRLRGKFDAEKATALGVFGRGRAQLTRGETVTVKVKEGDTMIERVVRPEDCIGASQAPGVSVLFLLSLD